MGPSPGLAWVGLLGVAWLGLGCLAWPGLLGLACFAWLGLFCLGLDQALDTLGMGPGYKGVTPMGVTLQGIP